MPDSSAARAVAERMAEAAEAFLTGLDPARLDVARWAWSEHGDEERRRWFYTPTDHGGLTLAEMGPTHYRRAMALLATGLSEAGYVTASTVMGLENVLDRTEDFAGFDFARERGRDPLRYHLRVFGRPGEPVWGWRFGGHHVSVNNLVVGGALVSSTPCFLGADPARSPQLGGASLTPLGATERLGRELAGSLTEAQWRRALLTPRAPVDIAGANRSRVSPGDRVVPLGLLFRGRFADPEHNRRMDEGHEDTEADYGITEADRAAVALPERPEGLPAAELDERQRELLRALLACYTGRAPEELVPEQAARFAGSRLDGVHFAWAGDLAQRACYYRVQGPRLLLEYDNAQRKANHAHAVWRDPEGDFGADVLAAHHTAHHSAPGSAPRGVRQG
jgi:hypothetical protein